MKHPRFRHVFGPVPSRRLGRSLGVDLVPLKICTFDCVYCQLGRTTVRTLERREYARVVDVLSEVDRKLAEGSAPDYVTLSGSGEPTLHSRLGEVIRGIKRLTRLPVAVLTNGSLLWHADVRRGLEGADLVLPSLDAGDEATFERVNRPDPGLSFELLVEGLRRFRDEFCGWLWLEVLLVGGITATRSQVRKIARVAESLDPDRIHINTVTRPPPESGALPVAMQALRDLASAFGTRAEVIAELVEARPAEPSAAESNAILDLLRRRPCTVRDIAQGLGVHPAEVSKRIEALERGGSVIPRRVCGDVFFMPVAEPQRRN